MSNKALSLLPNYILILIFTMFKRIQDRVTKTVFGREKVTLKQSFYELVDKDMSGNEVPMSTFQGDVLLVVNVASK